MGEAPFERRLIEDACAAGMSAQSSPLVCSHVSEQGSIQGHEDVAVSEQAVYARQSTVLWLGLGQLGSALASRLVAAGYAVTGVDPDPLAQPRLPSGRVYSSFQQVGERFDVVCATLPSPPELFDSITWILGLPEARRPQHFVNLSTVGPSAAAGAAAAFEGSLPRYVEAPVSGGVLRARTGDIAIYHSPISGRGAQSLLLLLSHLARDLLPMQSVEMASTVKLINNYVAISNALGTLEALRLAQQQGLDPQTTIEFLEYGTARSYVLSSTVKRPLTTGDLATGFKLRLALKDMLLLQETVGRNVSVPLDGIVKVLQDAVEQGYGDLVFPIVGLRHLCPAAGAR